MKRNDRVRYYHGGLGEENWKDYDRDLRDGDFGREHEDRYRSREGHRDFRDRRDFDRDRFRNYRSRDYEMEQNYYDNTRGEQHTLENIRQGYGFPSFVSSSNRASGPENEVENMRRERQAQRDQGYGAGRLSGYSGAAFGGSNYSVHGGFGGASDYGSMSGDRGDMGDYVSSSGYGGGYGSGQGRSDRGVPDFSRRSFGDDYGDSGMGSGTRGRYEGHREDYGRGSRGVSRNRGTYGHSSGDYGDFDRISDNYDRGGYIPYDKNY